VSVNRDTGNDSQLAKTIQWIR